MAPAREAQARAAIDSLLIAAGWAVQDMNGFNRHAAGRVAVREFPLPSGPCDYLLQRLRQMLSLDKTGLRDCQLQFRDRRTRALRYKQLDADPALLARLAAHTNVSPAAPRRRGRPALAAHP
jgi:hypothetical protein